MSPSRGASRESALPSGEGSRYGASEVASGRGRGGQGVPAGHVLLGEFGRAQGLRGEVRLKSYTADPMAIVGYGPFATVNGRTIVLTHVRQAAGDQPDILVARVEGVQDRDGAEALNRLPLHAPRERLGTTTEEDEFFLADLIGMDARTASGEEVGRVVDVPNFGGGDLLEIRPPTGAATILVPFTKVFVPELDLAAGRVTVVMPADEPDDGAEPPQS